MEQSPPLQWAEKDAYNYKRYFVILQYGQGLLCPRLPCLLTLKPASVPLVGLRCRPLRAKGKVFAKIYRFFVILS